MKNENVFPLEAIMRPRNFRKICFFGKNGRKWAKYKIWKGDYFGKISIILILVLD